MIVLLGIGCGRNSVSNPVEAIEDGVSYSSGVRANVPMGIIGSGGSDSNSSIVFTWKDESGDITLTYSNTGSYSYIYNDGDYYYSENGTYFISGNSVNRAG